MEKTGPKHREFQLCESGLHIHPQYPNLGATPDAMVECECHGKGVVEVKCPYCHRDKTPSEAAMQDKRFCLKGDSNNLHLDENHPYYYQVQAQMHLTERRYCDFVVYTNMSEGMHIERIYPNMQFIEELIEKVTKFFVSGILPELVGNWFTRPQQAIVNDADDTEDTTLICYCRSSDKQQRLVECTIPTCTIKTFHLDCLKLKRVRNPWKCPDCRKK